MENNNFNNDPFTNTSNWLITPDQLMQIERWQELRNNAAEANIPVEQFAVRGGSEVAPVEETMEEVAQVTEPDSQIENADKNAQRRPWLVIKAAPVLGILGLK